MYIHACTYTHVCMWRGYTRTVLDERLLEGGLDLGVVDALNLILQLEPVL